MKTKTAILAIFLTLSNMNLRADAATIPETKYVTEDGNTNKKNSDKSWLYNILLAVAAVAVATTAIILVSSDKGHHPN